MIVAKTEDKSNKVVVVLKSIVVMAKASASFRYSLIYFRFSVVLRCTLDHTQFSFTKKSCQSHKHNLLLDVH